MTGNVLVVAILVMFFVQLARRGDTAPRAGLGALGAVTFLASTVWYARRS